MKNKELDTFIENILENIKNGDEVKSSDIPNIDLYMDQVLTYMDNHIGLYKRDPSDKILTKTMINNYSKSGVLPPSNKKKYSKEHMILLIMIYSLKQTLSISDIKKLLNPLHDITSSESDVDLFEFFDTITNNKIDDYTGFLDQVNKTVAAAQSLFDSDDNDGELTVITTAYLLSIQASIYKLISGKLIDEFLSTDPQKKPDKKVDKNAE